MQTDTNPNYAAVYDVNLSEWNTMTDLDSAQQLAEKPMFGSTSTLLGLQQKVGKEDEACRSECEKKFHGTVADYQRAACLSGCQLGLGGTSKAGATFSPPAGVSSAIGTCNVLTKKGPQYCKGWSDTGCCSHLAPVNSKSALSQSVANDCNTKIPTTASGHCICADGGKTAVVDCGHPEFNCNQACAPAAKRGYTYDQTPKDCTLSASYPYLIPCGQKGYCYDGVKDETYTTYFEDGEACPANRAVGSSSYYLRQSGRSPSCSPASQYTVPFCPDPQYGEFLKQGCKQGNTVTSCLATVNQGWRADKTLCKTNHGPVSSGGDGTAVLKPCFIDTIVSWGNGTCSLSTCGPKGGQPCSTMDACAAKKGQWTGHVHCSYNNVPGLNIFPQDVKKIKPSRALYFYTAPPPAGPSNQQYFADPITSMSTGSDGVLYIYTHMNPGTASGGGPVATGTIAGPIKIPAKYASCFTNATTIYIAPAPGTVPEGFATMRRRGWEGFTARPQAAGAVAPPAAPAATACTPPPSTNSFEVHHGSYLGSGKDVIPMLRNITVERAKAICQQTPGCAGFTFHTDDPSKGVWFKSSATLASSGTTAPQWTSYTLVAGHSSTAPLGKGSSAPAQTQHLPKGMVAVPTGQQLAAACSTAANCSGGGTGAQIRKKLHMTEAARKKAQQAAMAAAVKSQAQWHGALSELNTIRGALPESQQQLAEKMEEYRALYEQIGEDRGMNVQLGAMLQDGHYSVNQANAGYYIWFILAISIMLAAIRQLNK